MDVDMGDGGEPFVRIGFGRGGKSRHVGVSERADNTKGATYATIIQAHCE
jgi:hypothetical protein